MPYVGLINNRQVGPYQVNADTQVLCPACRTKMGVKKSHYNQDNLIPRHFYHIDKSDCGGESDTHKRMKTLAMYHLQDQFPKANVELEKNIGDRFADVCATFPDPRKPYGKGIVVEAQFKNKDKDTADAQ